MKSGNRTCVNRRNRRTFTAKLQAAIATLLMLASCGEIEDPRDQSYELRTPQKYRSMVPAVQAGNTVTVTGAGAQGVFVTDRYVILDAYSIAKHETTWELWKEVYDWALRNDYTIANRGREGHGTDGTGGESWSSSSRITRPVTGVNWLDAVVWCNAYSELSGLEPVYHAADGEPLRVSSLPGGENITARRDKTGFRLPLETEWEFAARGGATGEDDWSAFAYSGGNDLLELAWHSANAAVEGSPGWGAHYAGGKTANRLDLYDMSGNAAEWCWDRYSADVITQDTPPDGAASGPERITRGGSWRSDAADCLVKARSPRSPGYDGTDTGFRVARTLPSEGDVVNTGDYPPSLAGTRWYWDSPWGMREIDFYEDGQALFTDPAEPPCLYDVSYTYNGALGRGTISGSYPAGDFQLRDRNKTLFFPQFRHFGHSVQFTFQEPE